MSYYQGPPSIPPNLAPGGVVVHVYEIPSGDRIFSTIATTREGIAAAQLEVVNLIRSGKRLGVRLYHGDTGEPHPGWWHPERPAPRRAHTRVAPRSMDGAPDWEGVTDRRCGDHRTVGPHRAWCHECGEWCYPDDQCLGCV